MVFSFAVRTDVTEERKKEYAEKLDEMSIEQLIGEFLSYLDYKEVKDDHEISPIQISCCRCLMIEPLQMVLDRLRDKSKNL